jgi:hypothetical protein
MLGRTASEVFAPSLQCNAAPIEEIVERVERWGMPQIFH